MHGVEQRGRALELRVGDENILIRHALELEAARHEADGGEGHEVVALPAGEGDREATIPVGARDICAALCQQAREAARDRTVASGDYNLHA